MSRPGSGGVASWSHQNQARRERLRQLAVETADVSNDPYFMKNHLGQYECKLCLTIHKTEGSYMSHTQGKKHQENLGRRAQRLQDEGLSEMMDKPKLKPRKTAKIGRPGYKIVKQKGGEQYSLLFQIYYPQIEEGLQPRHRFMSTYEQKLEPQDPTYQYIMFAAEPYETIAFKIPNKRLDKREGRFFTHWDADKLQFTLQLWFEADKDRAAAAASASTAPPTTMDMDMDS